MEKIMLGLFFIFFKTNVAFVDTGIVFYVTNVIGYLFMYVGVRELQLQSDQFKRIRLWIGFMLAHSVFFVVLNGTGNSIQTHALSTFSSSFVGFFLLALALVGMSIIFYILHLLLQEGIFAKVDRLVGGVFAMFIVAGICFFVTPSYAFLPMIVLFLLEAVLLIRMYATIQQQKVISA